MTMDDQPRHKHTPPRVLLELTRPLNVALAGIGALIGAIAIGPGTWATTATASPAGATSHLTPLVLGMVAVMLGTAGGNTLNDILDLRIDRKAHPDRPLPSGRASRRAARNLVLIAWPLAVAAAFLANAHAGFLAAVNVGVLAWYELEWKDRPLIGNIAVAAVAGTVFPLGALAVGAWGAAMALPLVMGVLASVAHLGRELMKDAEDATHDRAVRKTYAVAHGAEKASRLGAAFLILAVGLSILPVASGAWGIEYLAVVIIADAMFIAAARAAREDPARGQRLTKVAMIIAVAAFFVGGITNT